LFEVHDGALIRYRCRVGHAYSSEAIDAAQGEAVERALWAALRSLQERVGLMRKLAEHARHRGHETVAMMFDTRAADVDKEAQTIRRVIMSSQALEPVGQEEG
jgi:two-component system chemotaxis response regulator CheB